MANASSNMISKYYCPSCESFDLTKLHRNFLQKRILNSPNKLQCQSCERVLRSTDFDENIPMEMPLFIGSPPPAKIATVTPEMQGTIERKFSEASITDEEAITNLETPDTPDTPDTNNAKRWLKYSFGLIIAAALSYFAYTKIQVPILQVPILNEPTPSVAKEPIQKTQEESTKVPAQVIVAIQPQEPDFIDQSVRIPQVKSYVEITPKLPMLLDVPTLDSEIRFVLPLEESSPVVRSDNNTSINTVKKSDIINLNIEKDAIKLIHHDLDKLFN